MGDIRGGDPGKADGVVRGNSGNLTPFRKGEERAAAAGRKGAAARRASSAARRADMRGGLEILADARETFDREHLGENAAALASWVMGEVAAGRIPIRNADEAATLLRVVVDIARLEAGQVTSATASVTVSPADLLRLSGEARALAMHAIDVGEDVDRTG